MYYMLNSVMFVTNSKVLFFRNNKNHFSTTIIKKKDLISSRKILFTNNLNYVKLNFLKNKTFMKQKKQLTLVLKYFRKELKKQYALKGKQKKNKKYKQQLSQRKKLFLKRIIFKKVLNNAIKKMNIYVFRRARIVYKQLKQERLKLIFTFQKQQYIHNKTLEKILLKKRKERNKFFY